MQCLKDARTLARLQGGKPFSGLINHAWEDADGKGGGRRSDERVKDLDRWGVKGGSLLADNLPKNGFGASVKLRDDDRAIGVPPGRPIVRFVPAVPLRAYRWNVRANLTVFQACTARTSGESLTSTNLYIDCKRVGISDVKDLNWRTFPGRDVKLDNA